MNIQHMVERVARQVVASYESSDALMDDYLKWKEDLNRDSYELREQTGEGISYKEKVKLYREWVRKNKIWKRLIFATMMDERGGDNFWSIGYMTGFLLQASVPRNVLAMSETWGIPNGMFKG